MKTRLIKLNYLLPLFILATLLSTSCDRNPDNTPVVDVAIDTSFAQRPPVAENVSLKIVDLGNVLIAARFTGAELDKIRNASASAATKGAFLPFMLDDEKITLRDDGQGGDEKSGDGIFSTKMKVTETDLIQLVTQHNNFVKELANRPFAEFDARVKLERPKLVPLDIEKLRRKEFIDIRDLVRPLRTLDPKLKPNSLMITDVNVVEDPTRTIIDPCNPLPGEENKPWTFAKLMTDMSSSATVSNFTLKWLESWTVLNTINSDPVVARTTINNLIINPWKAKSNFSTTGKLDMRFAPFKLIAIVNRMDLGGAGAYGGGAGEGRFVFCALDANCNPIRNFTVIFEYGIPIRGCTNIKNYAQQWYDLKDMALGSPAYNAALEAITNQFASAGAAPSKPNGSALNQLRTNENRLASPWELREWRISSATNLLEPVTTKNEAMQKFNGASGGTGTPADVAMLASWANGIPCGTLTEDQCCKKVNVPVLFSGTPFLSGHSIAPFPTYFWNGAGSSGAATFINSDNVRFCVSLNTCSGCHTGETQTFFTHVTPPPSFGTPASLSGFLTGISVADPAGRGGTRTFDDLERRSMALDNLINTPCKGILGTVKALTFVPLNFTH